MDLERRVVGAALAAALAGCDAGAYEPLASTATDPAVGVDAGMDGRGAPPGVPDSSLSAQGEEPVDAAPSTDRDAAAVADPPGVFVAVGYGGRRVRSIDDGATWTDDVALVAQGGDDDRLLRSVVYGDGVFVALGYRASSSVDGKTWSAFTSPFGQWIGAAAFTRTTGYVAVGGYGLHATSRDGTSWVDHAFDTIASHAHDGIAFGGGRFVAANDDGARASSPDGITWTRAIGSEAVRTYGLAFGNGVFVALGDTSVVRSTNGGATFGAAVTLSSASRGVVFAQGHFTALSVGRVFTSPDGVAWMAHPSPNARRGTVAFGHGTYVSLGDDGVQRSTNGIDWTPPVRDGSRNPLEAIAFGPR